VVDQFVDKLNQSEWLEVNKDPKHSSDRPTDADWATTSLSLFMIKDKNAPQPDKNKKAGKS
jgi:hypothetical protein